MRCLMLLTLQKHPTATIHGSNSVGEGPRKGNGVYENSITSEAVRSLQTLV